LSTRSILVSYAGYPYTFNSLMPDNGLANLAGALLCAGHETLVLDHGTVDNVAAMFPRSVTVLARETYSSAMECIRAGKALSQETLRSFALSDARLREASQKRCQEVAEEVVKHIQSFGASFVGFKLWNGDGFTGTIQIAERVKAECKNVRVFAGGAHVDIFRGNILEATDAFDALVLGEGEETIVQLAEFVQGKRNLADVDNAIFKENGRIIATRLRRVEDLNTLPLPCYGESVYPAMNGHRKIKIVVLDESRGCPFGCHFCIHPIKSGLELRTKAPRRVVHEMEKITNEVGTHAFRYAGSATPPLLAKRIAELILDKQMTVLYSTFGNAAHPGPDAFEEIQRSGCMSIFFGIESGSVEILRRSMGKRTAVSRLTEVIGRSKKAGLFTVGSIIFPAPFETEESEEQTLRLLCDVKPDSVVVQFPILYPQTEWAKNPGKFGLSFDETEYIEAAMTYKAKPLMPIGFWDDLPFSMNGKDFRTIRAEASRFSEKLERMGILTSVSDDLALMAKLAGFEGRERAFRDLTQSIFFCGDVERIGEIVADINSRAANLEGHTSESLPLKP
jgi:radical SAM superfamily enzyme YgiQ (UPF0313 family)